jgi:hypothetical protein
MFFDTIKEALYERRQYCTSISGHLIQKRATTVVYLIVDLCLLSYLQESIGHEGRQDGRNRFLVGGWNSNEGRQDGRNRFLVGGWNSNDGLAVSTVEANSTPFTQSPVPPSPVSTPSSSFGDSTVSIF